MRLRKLKNTSFIIDNSKYIVFDPYQYKNKWYELFRNNNPIYIEIGMGKGKFILENALKYPYINFIGIEKYDNVIARAIKKIEEFELSNLKLIKIDAIDIDKVFEKEISRIYLNFSDPWPKERHIKRRLTNEQFLEKYEQLFLDYKEIFLKTDDKSFFDYSLNNLIQKGYEIKNISYNLKDAKIEDNITTEYEDRFMNMNKNIYRLEAYKE